MKEKILSLLNKAKNLPGFPDVLRRLQEVLGDPKSNFNDIVNVIELDPVLSGKIMSVSNSVFYTRGAGPSKSLNIAVNKIGRDELAKIIYPLEFSKLFTESSVIDFKDFWRHSVGVAILSQKLAEHTGLSKDESSYAYFAGLIHDIGIMVFSYLIPGEYSAFLEKNRESDIPLQHCEIKELGIDHAELGAEFGKYVWELDKDLYDSIRHHHLPYPKDKKISKCVKIVNVADGILNSCGIQNGIEYSVNPFYEGAWLDLGFNLDDTHILINKAIDALNQGSMLLSFK